MKAFKMAAIVVAGVALAFAPLTSAQQVPRFDVEAHCNEIADFSGDFSNTLYNSCIDMEQSAYNGIKDQWASLPASIQSHCDQVASFGGPGSYTLLESCVDMEVSAGSNRSEFSFD